MKNLRKLSCPVKSSDFSKEWNYVETKGMECIIHEFFKGKKLKNHKGKTITPFTKKDIDDVFGLPYTSSSDYAMLGADCNNWIYINDKEHISHFAIRKEQPILITEDKDNKQRFYTMELD